MAVFVPGPLAISFCLCISQHGQVAVLIPGQLPPATRSLFPASHSHQGGWLPGSCVLVTCLVTMGASPWSQLVFETGLPLPPSLSARKDRSAPACIF